VRCGPDAKVTLQINLQSVNLGPGPDWYTVPALMPIAFRWTLEDVARAVPRGRAGSYMPVVVR
jgi:hypothetical protein